MTIRSVWILLALISCDEPKTPPQIVKKPEVEKASPPGYPWDHGDPVVMPGELCPPLEEVNVEACLCWAERSERMRLGKVECDDDGRYPEEERKRWRHLR